MRNRLYFSTGLHERDDVLAVSYENVVSDPEAGLRRVCGFVGLPYRSEVSAHIDQRSARASSALALDSRVRALCDELQSGLDAAALTDPRRRV
jgi:hypothetical protein